MVSGLRGLESINGERHGIRTGVRKKQRDGEGRGREQEVMLWTLNAHSQGHTSSSMALPPEGPRAFTWDQVFTHRSLGDIIHPNQHSSKDTLVWWLLYLLLGFVVISMYYGSKSNSQPVRTGKTLQQGPSV